jgi:hypothetical protein
MAVPVVRSEASCKDASAAWSVRESSCTPHPCTQGAAQGPALPLFGNEARLTRHLAPELGLLPKHSASRDTGRIYLTAAP